MMLKSREKILDLEKPHVMGILNVTPDSFSDGGKFLDPAAALVAVREMISVGVDIVDIGAESSGPGSKDVSVEKELERLIPVLSAVRSEFPDVWISVDTYKAEVARQAIAAGADMVNDVTAFRGDQAMAQVVAESGVPVVLMFSAHKTARTVSEPTEYEDVMKTVCEFLDERVSVALGAGISKEQIILDPGMGAFVSSIPKYSLEILQRLQGLVARGFPVLVGPSNKGFIGQVLGGAKGVWSVPVGERGEGNLAAMTIGLVNGAKIVRMHDVKAAVRVRDFVYATMRSDKI